MKLKKFKIKIQTSKQTLDEFEKTWKIISVNKGNRTKSDDDIVLCFADLSMVSKVLSTERLRIIQTIRKNKPTSVNQLAQMLERSQANVHKDVHYLAKLGILDLKKIRKPGKKSESIQPEFNWDGFDIAV